MCRFFLRLISNPLSNLAQSSHTVAVFIPIVQTGKLRLILSHTESGFQYCVSACCSQQVVSCLCAWASPGPMRLKAWPPSMFSWGALCVGIWNSKFLIPRSEVRVLQRGGVLLNPRSREAGILSRVLDVGLGPSSTSTWLCDLGNAISQAHVPPGQ